MHFLQIVSIALGVSSAAAAATKDRYIRRATGSHYAPRTMASAARGAAHNVKRTVMSLVQSSDSSPGDFVIGDIHTTQAIDPASTTKFLDAISCMYATPTTTRQLMGHASHLWRHQLQHYPRLHYYLEAEQQQ